jgi:hypothetical protein
MVVPAGQSHDGPGPPELDEEAAPPVPLEDETVPEEDADPPVPPDDETVPEDDADPPVPPDDETVPEEDADPPVPPDDETVPEDDTTAPAPPLPPPLVGIQPAMSAPTRADQPASAARSFG